MAIRQFKRSFDSDSLNAPGRACAFCQRERDVTLFRLGLALMSCFAAGQARYIPDIAPALGLLGDARAVPILIGCLSNRDDHWLAREAAARSLGSIGDPRAVPHLLNAAWMADTRGAAIGALAAMREAGSLEVMISALDDGEDQETRDSAIRGLAAIGQPAVPELARLLATHNPEYPNTGPRVRVAGLLGRIGGTRAQAALEKAANDANRQVAEAARAALALPAERHVPKQ